MTYATLRIKNLSISLEALSRIHGYDTLTAASRIEALLKAAIDEAEEQEKDQRIIHPAPPARPTIPNDDDIPF